MPLPKEKQQRCSLVLVLIPELEEGEEDDLGLHITRSSPGQVRSSLTCFPERPLVRPVQRKVLVQRVDISIALASCTVKGNLTRSMAGN